MGVFRHAGENAKRAEWKFSAKNGTFPITAMPRDSLSRYARDLERALERLRADRLRLHVPRRVELRRRRPGAHFHPAPELFFQTGGGTDFDCPADRFRLGTGDVCVMPRGVPHAETPRDARTPYGILVCMLTRDGLFLNRGRADAARRIHGYDVAFLPGARARDAFRYLDDVSASEVVPAAHRHRYGLALVEAFLLCVLGEIARGGEAEPPTGSPLVREAENLARSHLSDPALSVARLAASLGCSADHLSRRFRAERGTTLVAWITDERLELAREMLADPRYNVSEVSWACGFAEPSYFIRVFRARTGFTPRTYRKTLAGT